MLGFSSSARYGLLLDIGSGSVGCVVVESIAETSVPTVIFSARTQVPLQHIQAVEEAKEALLRSIAEAPQALLQTVIARLQEHDSTARISHIQVTVSAPWAHCISQPIRHEQDQPFSLTPELVSELATVADHEAITLFAETHQQHADQFIVASRAVSHVRALGYTLPVVDRQETTEVSLVQLTTLLDVAVHTEILRCAEAFCAGVPVQIVSGQIGFLEAVHACRPFVQDYCLLTVTHEATELGVVRDNALLHSLHVPFGAASIAREVSASAGVPLATSYAQLADTISLLPTNERVSIVAAYTEQLTNVFSRVGSSFSVPRTFYVLADATLQPFLQPLVTQVGKKVTHATVSPLAFVDIDADPVTADAALQVAARFFHTQLQQPYFTYD